MIEVMRQHMHLHVLSVATILVKVFFKILLQTNHFPLLQHHIKGIQQRTRDGLNCEVVEGKAMSFSVNLEITKNILLFPVIFFNIPFIDKL